MVISASHNTFEFNGIKFFSNKGMKIPDEIEEEIEEIIESGNFDELTAKNENIGVSENTPEYIEKYKEFIVNIFKDSIAKNIKEDFTVGIDTANGATYKIAEKIFKELGINYKIINNTPDGININEKCGSTHLEQIKEYVKNNNLSLGIAYDGDGDRCLAIDENGKTIDGDVILATISKYLKDNNKLKSNTLISILLEKNMNASDVFKQIDIYPQVLVNAKVDENKKYDYSEDEEVQNEIKKLEQEFSGEGRVLIRTSGTEPLVRVMIEGKELNKIEEKAKELAKLVETKFN